MAARKRLPAGVKQRWEKRAKLARLVRTEVRGTVSKTKAGANWKRSDGTKGKAKSERAAKRIVEADGPPVALPLPAKKRAGRVLTRKQQTEETKRAARGYEKELRESGRAGQHLTGDDLYRVAAKVPKWGRFHSKVFLFPVLAEFGLTPQEARARLLELHRNDEITLTRADLVDAMNSELVRLSEIDAGVAGARFHFLAPRDE